MDAINELAASEPGIGHNAAPLSELLSEDAISLKPRADQLLAAAGRAAITSDDDAARVSDLIALIRNHEREVDRRREERKQPYLDGCRTIDRAFGALRDPLTAARLGPDRKSGGLCGMLTAWEHKREQEARRERERIEAEARQKREEAERLALAAATEAQAGRNTVTAELQAIEASAAAGRLEARAAATTPAPIRAQISNVNMRREIVFEIADLVKALAWLRRHYESPLRQAVRTIIGAHLRTMGVDAAERAELPGVNVTIAKTAQVRR